MDYKVVNGPVNGVIDGNFIGRRSYGISTSGEYLKSDYFSRLEKLGDFLLAAKDSGSDAYHYPYLDFGISKIYGNYYYVIGMILNSK